jgi:hypothetical protein
MIQSYWFFSNFNNNDMKVSLKYLLFCILTVFTLQGCTTNKNIKSEIKQATPNDPSLSNLTAREVCPIPPINYEKIPGYQPDTADPSLSSKLLEFVSPTLEGNPTFYLSILQQPVKFCGIAKENIVKIELFASGIYIYEKRYLRSCTNLNKPDPALI